MTEALAHGPAGQADARFAELVAPHRAGLLAHCYRMTGSLHDAEDALQETLLRAWQSFDRFEGRSSLRTWLFTIATNAARRQLERQARRVMPVDLGPPAGLGDDIGPPLVDTAWISPFPTYGMEDVDATPAGRYENKEAVELAFVAALQHLPRRQRAVLLLRDVLSFSAQETADAMDSTTASVNSALQRAHRTMAERLPERSQQATLRSLGDAEVRAVVERLVDAWERHDVEALVAVLTDDVELAMPPMAEWFRGRSEVEAFLRLRPLSPATERWRVVPVEANGQPACLFYLREDGRWLAHSLDVLTLRGTQVSAFTAFLDPAVCAAFGPAELLPRS